MKIIEHTPKGVFERNATKVEVHEAARNGNRNALREIVEEKSGWKNLTPKDKDDILKILTGCE